jgi:hypothetical protein
MNHEIAIKIKEKEWREKITLGWFTLFDEGLFVSHGVFPLSAMALGVFLEKEDEKE